MQSQIISILSLLIGGLAVFLFFAAMFTKQISGLEFVLLVQSAYLSLLYYGGALSLPFYCLRNLSLSTLSLPVYWAFAPYATETDNLQIDNFGMSK